MYIGEVAKQTGLTIKAIRFYEAKGLIPAPKRLGRYRIYSQADIELLLLIKEAKDLGISLSALSKVIKIDDNGVNWQVIKQFLCEVKTQLKHDILLLEKKITMIDQCIKGIA